MKDLREIKYRILFKNILRICYSILSICILYLLGSIFFYILISKKFYKVGQHIGLTTYTFVGGKYMSMTDIIKKMELELQLIINKNLYEQKIISYQAYQSFMNFILKKQVN
jgi:hypothetical protein